MKKAINFYLNGRAQELAVKPETTVLMLRGLMGMTGTKEGCGEGDCGACTVVVGEARDGEVHYKPVVGCLHLAAQLEGKHLITVEGLAEGGKLHPIQKAIMEAHATQCGFCTPGVAMSLQALYLEERDPKPEDIRRALEGNLCRCTGYVAIRRVPAFITDLKVDQTALRPEYLSSVEQAQLGQQAQDLLLESGGQVFFSPVSIDDLKAFLREKDREGLLGQCRFVNGGTDVVVGVKKRNQHPSVMIDLSRIDVLRRLEVGDDAVVVGGAVELARVAKACVQKLPILSSVISRMCSEQVRTIATMAGNIANASPVADTVPLLMVLGAVVNLQGHEGARSVAIDSFYHGYKKLEMKPGEWIDSISIPVKRGIKVNFEKATKRRELDISAVNSAIALETKDGVIASVKLACGGVAATTVIMSHTASALVGRPFTEETFLQAAELMVQDATPISDVRGSDQYRRRVLKNLLVKHYAALA